MNGDERLSIQEFSKLTGIKQTTLRYYDELGLFSPSKRGENSYRYYSPQQLITINAIHLLHSLDMPIKQICEIERNRTPESVYDVLGEKERTLGEELSRLKQSYSVICTLRSMISAGFSADLDALTVVPMEEQHIVIGEHNDFSSTRYFYESFSRFCVEAAEHTVDLRFPVGGLFDDFDSFVKAPSQPSHFFSVDPSGADKKKAAEYLVGYGRGYYGEMGNMPERIGAYLKEHGLKSSGPLYIIYLHDEICVSEQNNYLFQASVRVV